MATTTSETGSYWEERTEGKGAEMAKGVENEFSDISNCTKGDEYDKGVRGSGDDWATAYKRAMTE